MDLATVKKILKNTDRNDLLKIIAKFSSHNKYADEWLLNYGKKATKDKDDYDLVVQKQIEHYWNVAEEIIDEANENGGTSYEEEDEAEEALNEINELVKQNKTSWKFRRQIVDGMLRQFYCYNSGFEDSLVDSCEVLCQSEDEKLYLADALTKSKSNYYRKFAAEMYLSLGDEEKFIEILSQNLEYASDYIGLADYYKKHNLLDKAIALVEEALVKVDGSLEDAYIWLFTEYTKAKQEDKIEHLYNVALSKKWEADTVVKLMYDYYADDYEKRKEYLLKMMDVCNAGVIRNWFEKCKVQLTKEDFLANVNHLYRVMKKRNVYEYLQLRIDEGKVQEVYEYLRDNCYCVDYGHVLSKQIAEFYPREVCLQYWKECYSLCRDSNRKNYMSAVRILVQIKKISQKHKLTDEWQRDYLAFLDKNRRKPLLMGYIKDEKALNNYN